MCELQSAYSLWGKQGGYTLHQTQLHENQVMGFYIVHLDRLITEPLGDGY